MTGAAIALPLVAAAAFGALAPPASRRLPPREATWMLTVGSLVATLSALAVLALLASVLLAQVPGIASEGHWSATALREHSPVDREAGLAASVCLLGASASAAVATGARAKAILAAHRACREMPPGAGGLLVVAGTDAGAVAVPGRPGRIVVSRALLVALSPTERRALLAHERAHLDHRHHWHLALIAVATATNPLLRGLRDAGVEAIERWADEEAAIEVGARRPVAAAIARAAVMTRVSASRPASLQLGAATHATTHRVAAMLDAEPRPRPGLLSLAAALLLVGVAAVAVAGASTEDLFELASRALMVTRGH